MSDSTSLECPFCHLGPGRILDENGLAIAFLDAFPVSPGHTLVVPRRHVSDFFDLSAAEIAAIVELVFRMRPRLIAEHGPSGFNVGVNVGAAAGQTVMHAHVHLIPRYLGDVLNPTGGIRNVIPGMGPYGQAEKREPLQDLKVLQGFPFFGFA
jgi:diadenosine tetraphosphate (Ap4A) HIT family hydrolase